MVQGAAFCPHCGATRPEWAKFCGTCGNGYDATPRTAAAPASSPPVAPPPVPAPGSVGTAPPPLVRAASPFAAAQPTTAAALAGVAWIICGAFVGYLAFLQASLVNDPLFAGSSIGAYVAWNALAAVLSIGAGALLLVRPTRSLLTGSVVWGTVSVLWNGWSILNGATHWTFIGATVSALVALVVAAVARSGWTDPVPEGHVQCAHCAKWIPPNPTGICHLCGHPIAPAP